MLESIKRLWEREFVQNVLHTFATKGVLIVLGLVSSVVITRGLGPEGKGIYAVLMTLVIIGYQFGHLGLHTSNTYYIAKDRALFGRIFINSIIISITCGLVMFGVITYGLYEFPTLLQLPDEIDSSKLLLIGIPLALMSLLFKNLMFGLQEFRKINYFEIIARSVYTAGLVVLYFAGVISVTTAFLFYLLENFLVVLLVGSYVKTNIESKYKASYPVFQENLKYGLRVYITVLLSFMVVRSDILLVNYFLEPERVGFYSTAVQVVDQFKLLGSVTASVLMPKLASTKSLKEKYRLNLKVVGRVAVIMVVGGVLALLLAEPAFRLLYGEEFLPSVPSFRILIIAMIFLSIETIMAQFLAAIGLPIILAVYWFGCFALNVGLNFVFIPKYGEIGAAYSSLIAYAIILILVFFLTRKLARNSEDSTELA